MAVSVALKAQGLQGLQERLNARKEALERVLEMKLMQLAEEAVTHAKQNKGYKDRTANLKNSISFALFHDGEVVTQHIGNIPSPQDVPKGHNGIAENMETYAKEVVRPKGYSLVVVAGMEYGAHVEHKGYNVLYLTKYFLREEMKKILEETLSDINNNTL